MPKVRAQNDKNMNRWKDKLGRRRSNNGSLMLMPRLVDAHGIRLESNLLNLGLFAATNEIETLRRTEKEVTREGYTLNFAVEFRCHPAFGLPAMADRDKFIALLRILKEDGVVDGKAVTRIRLNCHRMADALGLPPSQEFFKEIERWGQRMTATTITTRGVAYSSSGKAYSNDTFHVFNSFGFSETRSLDDSAIEEDFEIELSQWVTENLDQEALSLPRHE